MDTSSPTPPLHQDDPSHKESTLPTNSHSDFPEYSPAEWAALPRMGRKVALTRDLGPQHRLHLRLAEKSEADNLIVFMPAAQSRIENGQINPLFSRWAWASDHPESHIIAVSDPSIYYHSSLAGGWFVSPDFDILREIATDLRSICSALETPSNKVTIYGSSLGGFGAIALASIFQGSHAIAEVPQVNVMDWPVASAKRNIESHITKMELADYIDVHPEQIDLLSRFEYENCVPGFTLVTNAQDASFSGQMEFLQKASGAVGLGSPQNNNIHLIVEKGLSGHKVLSRAQANSLIRSSREARARN